MKKMMHAYILSGSPAATSARAREMAAAALCEGTGEKPCRVCRHCRKVFTGDFPGIHPDVTLIVRTPSEPGGRIRRNIVVGQSRAVVADAAVRPNEANGKAYIFPEADTMNSEAQNALLKLLEEPPAGVVLLLCAEHPERLLATVRSRCAEIRLSTEGEEDRTSEAYLRAEGFLEARGDRAELLRCCTAMENLDRQDLIDVVQTATELAVHMVKDRRELLSLEAFLNRALEYLSLNVGQKHVTGYLSTYIPNEKKEC